MVLSSHGARKNENFHICFEGKVFMWTELDISARCEKTWYECQFLTIHNILKRKKYWNFKFSFHSQGPNASTNSFLQATLDSQQQQQESSNASMGSNSYGNYGNSTTNTASHYATSVNNQSIPRPMQKVSQLSKNAVDTAWNEFVSCCCLFCRWFQQLYISCRG